MSAPEATRLFRKAALDRLSSPEQLDKVMVVARPLDWLALAVLLALTLAALVWSITGSIPTRVKGSGILVNAGGQLFAATATGSGAVVALSVGVGDAVREGDVVARIAQPDLVQGVENARATVGELETRLEETRRQLAAYAEARQANGAARRTLFTQALANAEAKARVLEARLSSEEQLLSRSFITAQRVNATRQELAEARQAATEARGQLIQLEADEIAARNNDDRDLRTAESNLAEARRKLQDAELLLEQRQSVRSPASGRVNEIKAPVGTQVAAGTPVVAVESGRSGLQLVLYLPPKTGKQVKPGMSVRIAPSVVKKEEFGTLVGTVVAVSDFPSTPQAMQATLQNDQLVSQFSKEGPPFAARIDLLPDSGTASGYRWAGGAGPELTLTSGTPADAEVTVREQSPLSFVIPLLRTATGL